MLIASQSARVRWALSGMAMAFVKKTFTPEQIDAARRLYENHRTAVDDVAASLGITRGTLKSRIEEWGWPERRACAPARPATKTGRSRKAPPARRRRVTLEAAQKKPRAQPRPPSPSIAPPRTTPEALAARVQRVVERELDAIDSVLSVLGVADSADAERSARTLASLARALTEVMRLTAPEQTPDPDDDDAMPRDLDEFRRELARRIEALAADAEAAAPGDGG